MAEAGSDSLRDRIIDAALSVAEENAGWYDLRLYLVAQRLGVPLSTVLDDFRDADAIHPLILAARVASWLRPLQ